MTHDEHMARLPDQLHQRIAGNAAADLTSAVRLLGAATEEGEVQPVLDNCLITAAAQGHLDGKGSKIVTFFKIGAVNTQAEGNGGRQTRGVGEVEALIKWRSCLLVEIARL